MSRPEDQVLATEPTHVARKRKLERACDQCRKRRTRCDGGGSVMNGGQNVIHRLCTTCTGLGISCTYLQASTRRGPPPGYVEALEFKLERLSAHLANTFSADDLVQVAGPAISQQTFVQETFAKQLRDAGISTVPKLKRKRTAKEEAGSKMGTNLGFRGEEAVYKSDFLVKGTPLPSNYFIEDDSVEELDQSSCSGTDPFQASHSTEKQAMLGRELPARLDNRRFIGRNANWSLLRAAYRSAARLLNYDAPVRDLPGLAKPSVWCDKPWESDALDPSVKMPIDYSQWPTEDLAEKLIRAYFDLDNLLLPLLNRVLFKKDYYALRWRDDREFARLCLCVFATASPWMTGEDQNSVQDDSTSGIERHSAGWHWMKTVMQTASAPFKPATLVSLQVQTLVGNFMGSRRTVLEQWTVVGSALRSCIDIGLHKQAGITRFRDQLTIESYKRVVWCLIYLDRQGSTLLGRPLAVTPRSFDLELPIDVDDEYWDTGNAETNFRQPRGRPSKLSFFLLLLDIQSLAMTANQIEGSYQLWNTEARCEAMITFNLDATAWLQKIPPHLSVDPEQNVNWMRIQSGTLASYLYQYQILANKPVVNVEDVRFFESRRVAGAICDAAAKDTCRVVRGMQFKCNLHPALCSSIMSACIIRLHSTSTLGLEAPSASQIAAEAIADVQLCVDALSKLELGWIRASRFKSILLDLVNTSPPTAELSQESATLRGSPTNQISKVRPKTSLDDHQPYGTTSEPSGNPFAEPERGTPADHIDQVDTGTIPDGQLTIMPELLGSTADLWGFSPNNFNWEEWELYLSLGVLEQG